jgi:hypothetical protein
MGRRFFGIFIFNKNALGKFYPCSFFSSWPPGPGGGHRRKKKAKKKSTQGPGQLFIGEKY